MTPSPSTPQPADRPSARRRVRQVLTRARTLWRDMTGESAYDRYLERYAREEFYMKRANEDVFIIED